MTESISHRWQQWLQGVDRAMQERSAHPARTVVLLPYAQLMAEAARRWVQTRTQGFAPRFETTQNWCQSLGGWSPQGADYTGDAAWDSLTARALLERAGVRDPASALVSRLVDAARELAPRVAALMPVQRLSWAEEQRGAMLQGLDAAVLQQEAQLAQVALAWLAHSAFFTDRLFDPALRASVDCLIIVPGFQPEPLHTGLQQVWEGRALLLETPPPPVDSMTFTHVGWHEAIDPQDEAQRSAACILHELEAGRTPVAVPVIDRALTRQVRALLDARGVQIRDETGWKLSTTRAAAQVMIALRACSWDASTDTVLDWLKHAPACSLPALRAIEARARAQGLRRWSQLAARGESAAFEAEAGQIDTIERWRALLTGRRTMPQWWRSLQECLQATGQWDALLADPAGQQVIDVLRLDDAVAPAIAGDVLWAGERLAPDEFVSWVDRALESASFKPAYPRNEQVIFLPVAQMLGREFAAVVMAGCDEVRLPASVEPAGLWTRAQRQRLGLPDRETLAQAQRLSFLDALCRHAVHVVWRQSDGAGEALLPGTWVRWAQSRAQDRVQGEGAAYAPAEDPRGTRPVSVRRSPRPAPKGNQLPVRRLSASAYQDLRSCPFRFFALRQLGLRLRSEIDVELAKSDVGLWVHEVLQRFHGAYPSVACEASIDDRRRALDQACADASAHLGLDAADLLPHMAAWPALRDGYLMWLADHERAGWQFDRGELEVERVLPTVTLYGRLDRVDRGTHGERMVIDYKTEGLGRTKDRIKDPLEDTQLAFYAALMPGAGIRAAYVNVGERDGTSTHEQRDVEALSAALLEGLQGDLARIAAGTPLPALGEGSACDHCDARGLCRRDFWGEAS